MRYSHEGRCHCGAIAIVLRTTRPTEDQVLGACQCGFCRKHNARAFSDPRASVTIAVHEPEQLQRMRLDYAPPRRSSVAGAASMSRWFSPMEIAPGARSTLTPWTNASLSIDQLKPGISAPRM
jgi:hypothetical protein